MEPSKEAQCPQSVGLDRDGGRQLRLLDADDLHVEAPVPVDRKLKVARFIRPVHHLDRVGVAHRSVGQRTNVGLRSRKTFKSIVARVERPNNMTPPTSASIAA